MFGPIGAFGNFCIIEIINRAQIAGDPAHSANWRFFGCLDHDLVLFDAQLDLPQLFVATVPELFFFGDILIDLLSAQTGIGNDLNSVKDHAAPPR